MQVHKDDIFDLHRKLFRAVEHLLTDGRMNEEDAKEYISFGVFPNHIHRRKEEHWRAVSMLADVLSQSVEKAEEKAQEITDDMLPEFAQGKVAPRPPPLPVSD